MKKLQKLGGLAALSQAFIYIAAFIFYYAILDYPTSEGPNQKLVFLETNQLALSLFNLIGYVLFGILLALLTLAMHERLKPSAHGYSSFASIFGFAWVVLVIASGMIGNIGLNSVIELASEQPELAMTVWITIDNIVEGLGGGNEIVGGLWVLFISIAGLNSDKLTNSVCYWGLLVGLSGILTVYPADLLTEIFGLSQIIWFVWIGILMLRTK